MNSVSKFHDSQYFIQLLVIITLGITLTLATIIYNNSSRSAPIFLFLLATGIGIMATLGWKRGSILGLLLVSISIVVKQFIAAWSADNLAFNLLELSLMAGIFGLTGYYHDRLRIYFVEHDEAKRKIKILDMEDSSVGLIRAAIGLRRLKEESDTAARFKYPISLVLVLVSPKQGVDWESGERISIMRAVATTIKDTTRVFDIPFLITDNKIALILTNTGINGTNKVISNIQGRLYNCRVITKTGQLTHLQQRAQIRSGSCVFLGYSTKPIDLLDAAEIALKRNIEANTGAGFQNISLDWETLGETVTSQTIDSDVDITIFEHSRQ